MTTKEKLQFLKEAKELSNEIKNVVFYYLCSNEDGELFIVYANPEDEVKVIKKINPIHNQFLDSELMEYRLYSLLGATYAKRVCAEYRLWFNIEYKGLSFDHRLKEVIG